MNTLNGPLRRTYDCRQYSRLKCLRYGEKHGGAVRLFALFPVFVQAMAGCYSDAGPEQQAPQPVVAEVGHGHFRGEVGIGSEQYYGEALFTADGEFRIYVSGPVNETPGGVLLTPGASTQVFGHLKMDGDEGVGDGLVVGEICAAATPGRFCGTATEVEIGISVNFIDGNREAITGEIRVPTSAGEEIWELSMLSWSIYYEQAFTPGAASGLYHEVRATFAQGEDVVVAVDANGQFFFQDAASGCTGNGVLSSHGKNFMLNVALSISNCNADYDYLNKRAYVGLATETQDGYWSYDTWLLIIAASVDGDPSAAVTMYAERF